MYTLLGFIFVCWLLASPGWRVFSLRRHTADGVRTHVNPWLVRWFTLSLFATIFWMWYSEISCMSIKPQDSVQDSKQDTKQESQKTGCPWRHVDTYMVIVLMSAFVSNLVWLIYLCVIDLKTLFHFGMGAVGTCILFIAGSFVFGLRFCWSRLQLTCWMAIVLGFAANICRIMSMERQEFSFFALSVALAAVLPEITWILNVIFVEQFTEEGKKCGFFAVFVEKNFYWKLSWTLNSLLRLPELIALLRQMWRQQMLTRARRLFGRDRR